MQLALDTGATHTLLRPALLTLLGYDIATAPTLSILTASGQETVALLTLDRFDALGDTRPDFPVVAHRLPAATLLDGLLGLDFLRSRLLTLDFHQGEITLSQPKHL